MWAAEYKKVPNVLSRCHTKRRVDGYYIPVSHDMMRQTNDCSPVLVMQHKVKYFL